MKVYLHLLLIVLSALFILLIIFNFGDIPNKSDNGFKRTYFARSYSKIHELHVRDTLYDIIGSTPSQLYFSISREGEVIGVDKELNNEIKRIKLPFFGRFYDSLQFSSLGIKIDSPFIYLFAENKPAIIKTNFDSTLFEVRMLPPGSFTREVMAGPDCFILRKFEPRLTDQLFVRYDFGTGQLKKEDTISQIYGDGGIKTDGQLFFDPGTKKLCYIYYYKNLVLSFDTSLTVVNRFHSIDTARSFKIQTGLVNNSGAEAYTNITPANIVNKASCVQNGLLFNMSALKADNESDSFFSGNSILDIIDLNNGRYLGSIHLPVDKGNKLSRFIVSGNQLIGLYANTIAIYDLDPAIFSKDQ